MLLKTPWRYTPDDLAQRLLFHGSLEPWRKFTPTPGMDGCFWACEGNPLIAQTYISRSSGQAMISFHSHSLDHQVAPMEHGSIAWMVAQKLGASAKDIEYQAGRAVRWTPTGNPVRYRDVMQHIESLGYAPNVNEPLWLQTRTVPGTFDYAILPKEARSHGRLLLIEPDEAFRVFDMANEEGDLQDLQYQYVETFSQAFERGFDAVKINDFCQSPSWGNVGHFAHGLSSAAITRLHGAGRTMAIAAGHDDFSSETGGTSRTLTEDFLQWHFSQVVRALCYGVPVPAEVISAHRDRIDALITQNETVWIHSPIDALTLDERTLAPDTENSAQLEAQLQSGWVPDESFGFRVEMNGEVRPPTENADESGALLRAIKSSGLIVPVATHLVDPFNMPFPATALAFAANYWSDPPAARSLERAKVSS